MLLNESDIEIDIIFFLAATDCVGWNFATSLGMVDSKSL
jgi:hypothetical protein